MVPAEEFIEMRAELDRLRREVQHLTMQVDDLNQPVQAFSTLMKAGLVKVRHGLGGMWWCTTRRVSTLYDKSRPADVAPLLPPYHVRVRRLAEPQRARVLHMIGNFYIGGSSRLIVDLIEHLGHRYEQKVIARDLPAHPAFTGISLQQVKRFRSAREALRLLRAYAPDIVHVHYLGHRRNEYSRMDWRWYRQVFEALEQYDCRVVQNVNIPVDPFYSRRVDCYVHVSNYVNRSFGFGDCSNLTIYPGSDLSLFRRTTTEAPPDDHIGMVYRLEGDKLDERAIDVFVEVARRRPQTRVSIVGGGRYLQAYRDRAREAGVGDRFSFPGYVAYEELPAWIERMSIFVAPVHKESFGQVAPFAMGMGIPVVGYDVGALQEITGAPELLAPPGNVERLVEITIDLLEQRDRRLRIGAANRRRAEERFSVEAMVEAYRSLYEQLLEHEPQPQGSFTPQPVYV